MSETLWSALCQKKSYDEVISILAPLYEQFFPIEIRFYLAEWMEKKLCCIPQQCDPEFDNYACNFRDELITEIRNIANVMNEGDSADGASRWYHFQKAADDLPQFNSNDLLLRLSSILQYEMSLFTCVQPSSLLDTDFDRQITEVTANANSIEGAKQELMKDFENFEVLLYEIEAHVVDNFTTTMDQEVAKLANQLRLECDGTQIVEKREKLFLMIETFACVVEQYTTQIINTHIANWKLHQKKYVSNTHVDLVRIQRWCEAIACAICKVRDQAAHIHEVQKNVKFQNYIPQSQHFDFLDKRLAENFLKLVEGSFVIEEQPSQVIKINNKIRASLRLLIGANFNDRTIIPSAQAFIVSDVQAREILSTRNLNGRSSGELVNFSANMAATKTNEYRANFNNMQLKKIDRALKRDVTDEKFAICFKVQLKFGSREVSIMRLSLPVVVIVHVNQENHALATVVWDSFAQDAERVPFAVPESVSWNQFASTLSMMFKSEIGRELTAENLHFIAEKLFNSEIPFPFNDPDNLQQVTWQDFCKRKIADRSFTFWEWFYSNLKLIKEHANVAWNSGYVEGFISKAKAEKKLKNSLHGTFLLRFSDSIRGSISIAYTMKSSSGKSSVMHINPFTSDDLRIHSLCDRLNGFNELKILYPNVDKEVAFVSSKSSEPTWRSGYLMPVQTTRLPSYDEVNYSNYAKAK